MLKGFQNEAKMDAGAAVGSQLLDFGSQNLQNITKKASQIDAKSMKNRGCVFGTFFERLGAARGGGATLRGHPFWRPFWTKNRKNVIQKRHAKIDVEKVLKINTKSDPK